MSRRSPLSPSAGTPRKALLRRALVLSLLGACVIAAPAEATGPKGPRYVLKVEEGVTTLPEYEHPDAVSATIESSHAEVVLKVIHGGLVVSERSATNGNGVWISPGPQVGDELALESPKGTAIARVVYDGLPAIDPTVCAGSTNFSGENTAGNVVEGRYEKHVLETPYHQSTRAVRVAYGEAQVKTLSGTTYGGNFLKPLEIGDDVIAVESLKTPLAGEGTYTYESETERPVGACPLPPPVVTLPALQGEILRLISSSIHGILRFGARDVVNINQPGTVVEDLYLKNGTLPAFAASSKHRRVPPALLLARGSAAATAAGNVTVILKLTSAGRRKLRSLHNANAVLITTLHSASGARINLARRAIKLHH